MSIFYYTDRRSDGLHFDSGAISNVFYDQEGQRLGVEFHKGSSVYVYDGVAESTFELFVHADSLRQFYINFIQSHYGNSTQYSSVARRHPDESQNATAADDSDATVAVTTLFGVKWVVSLNSSDEPVGPFEFVTNAIDEGEAVNNFWNASDALLPEALSLKIVSVTHYFE